MFEVIAARWSRRAAVGVGLWMSSTPALAFADDTDVCIQAYEQVQELKLDGKLLEAKDKATFCIQASCPEAIVSGCTNWLSQINDAVPTIVVSVRDAAGADVASARVLLDGVLVASEIDGRPIATDPGKHLLRVEPKGGAPIEQMIVVGQGVKNRAIVMQAAADGAASESTRATPEERGAPVGPLVLGGLALASFGVFAGLAAVGRGEVDDLRAGCGQTHSCAPSDVDAAKTKIIVGDVFLFTGIALAAGSVGWLIHHYVSEPDGASDAEPDVAWFAGASPTGAAAGLRMAF